MVIRILDQRKAPKSLDSLGLSPLICREFLAVLSRPSGIVLVTGPTGSGKSTTLYAALRTLYSPRIKIVTAEDPIEYTHPGICQTEVNADIGNTFARYLRSFLRQDPDIIMVGEIRDAETAEMALRAAQTGHVLLSTLHSINSTASVRRLLDLEMDPNSITSTLNGVLAQRLIRRNCSQCSEPYTPDPKILRDWFGSSAPPKVEWVHGRGCSACNDTGFSGRIAVNELWVPSPEEGILINKDAHAEDLRREALTHTKNLAEDALLKISAGESTLEEGLRLVPYEDIVDLRERGTARVLEELESYVASRTEADAAAEAPSSTDQDRRRAA
jgi:type II secretory ATPase GspE/PulE/Tfp pilus assembly ATPase PilB-like protein